MAMYRVKSAGRDSYAVFNQEVRREVSDQVEREGALRNALKRTDELLPYFQPIVSVETGELIALDALIRWHQADGRVIPPGDFLPDVEGLRLIGWLDFYMLTSIAQILAQPEHSEWPPVHVNCSSYSMTRPEFASAESLDLSVVAEGVEDQVTLDLLREMGAGQAQGYYFAKPMALEN
jgi:EAL domain-containing protein (putative c-di-GMP-specific phosphodiesterase class I)